MAKNKNDAIQNKISENIKTIQSLEKNKNNISGQESEIREEILNVVNATISEIPFIGELIRVKDYEKCWELPIEKILHNFALRLIVPEKYYAKVNEYVNSKNLNGRIVYQRYKGFSSLKELEQKKNSKNSLLNKIEFNSKSNYIAWLEDTIYNQYNYACVDDLQEFNNYEERAVTKEGLVKSIKGKHEKDDRPHILRKENYVLGWDNKVSEFRMFFITWRDSITDNIRNLNESLREIDFNNNPTTYIQLVASPKIGDEIKEFRDLLDKALPNIHEINATIDGKKNHFNNHIQPLIEKLKNEQWRKKVMEVRAWFNYKAEEFYKETKQKYKTYESMGQLSGGEKAQLTYTILGSAIAYQFGLTKDGLQSNSFRFIAIDEAFKAQDEDKARYLISLCKQLYLQLLVVTPSDNIHIVQNDISFVHYVERNGDESKLMDMPIKQFLEEYERFINDQNK